MHLICEIIRTSKHNKVEYVNTSIDVPTSLVDDTLQDSCRMGEQQRKNQDNVAMTDVEILPFVDVYSQYSNRGLGLST